MKSAIRQGMKFTLKYPNLSGLFMDGTHVARTKKKIICVKIYVHPCHHMPLRLRWDQNVKKILPDLNFITAGGICYSQTHRGS